MSEDSARFFEYGEVSLEHRDFASRQASIRICLPHCLLHAIIPSLLGGGFIDQLRIREPIVIWMPTLSRERISPELEPGYEVVVNEALKVSVTQVAERFERLARMLVDPADIIPMLPLGTYVTLRYRCQVDSILGVLEGVQATPVAGVPEFQWALATVLSTVLEEIQVFDARRLSAGT